MAGLVIGCTIALAVARALGALLYGVAPDDPMSFVAAGLALCLATIAGALIPALRVIRIDPATALRAD
jgi:ABC-type antimicrobial peptide transport system permease subunit